MVRRAVDNSTLQRWRSLEAEKVLCAISEFAKRDAEFLPRKNAETSRWHATVTKATKLTIASVALEAGVSASLIHNH